MAKLPAPPPREPMELAADGEGRAALLFLALDTQWHFAGMGGTRVGLNYAMIPAVAEMVGVAMEPRGELFLQLRTLEREALACLAERAKREERG